MTEQKPRLYSLLDVTETTPFGARARGPARSMLLLAAATQVSACTMGTEPQRDLGVAFDLGLQPQDLATPDQALTDGLGPIDDAGPDHGAEDSDGGVDAGVDGG